MPSPTRLGSLLLVGAGTAALLTGCAFIPVACPAVGYPDTLEVQIEAGAVPLEQVDSLEICGELTCASWGAPLGPAEDQAAGGPVGPEQPMTDSGGGLWVASTFGEPLPDVARVTALAADGASLGTATEQLSWEMDSGSQQCPGGSGAGPVRLQLQPRAG